MIIIITIVLAIILLKARRPPVEISIKNIDTWTIKVNSSNQLMWWHEAAINLIPGVAETERHKYSIFIDKGELYNWDDITPKVEKIIRF
jgi:hypothetical protein